MIVYDSPQFDLHLPGPGHVERPDRLVAARAALAGLKVEVRQPRPATPEELSLVHEVSYVSWLLSLRGRHATLDPDTATSPGSVDAALEAAGGALMAAEDALSGRPAFVLGRPPGHHATPNRAMGFCLFNSAALAAAWLAAKGRRVLVFDPDVHHGNGTKDIFWRRSDVLYVSLHRYPYYPGTGAAGETGAGEGRGATLNVPLPEGATDGHYHAAMRERVLPAVTRFQPDVCVISAGYDALDGDDMGGMELTVDGLAAMWGALVSRWPCLAVLEGGYKLETLSAGVRRTASVLESGQAPALDAADPPGWSALMARWTHPLLENTSAR